MALIDNQKASQVIILRRPKRRIDRDAKVIKMS